MNDTEYPVNRWPRVADKVVGAWVQMPENYFSTPMCPDCAMQRYVDIIATIEAMGAYGMDAACYVCAKPLVR